MSEVNEETSPVERVVINPVCIELELSTVCQIKTLLSDALGNAEELLNTHDMSLGRLTKKNKIIAENYETEIANTKNMLAILARY